MKLLGIDLEIGNPFEKEDGTSWPKEEAWLTEVGCVLYDTEMENQPVEIYSALVNEGNGVSEDAQEYTGITTEIIETHGKAPEVVAAKTLELIHKADYIVAHNGNEADKPWLKTFLSRYLDKSSFPETPRPWIDTMIDIEYPSTCRQRSLGYLASFHIILNSFPHRAITDVMTMMSIMFNYELDRVVAVSESPKVILKGLAPIDVAHPSQKKAFFTPGTSQYKAMEKWKNQAKKSGFRWDGGADKTGQKCWYKVSNELFISEGKEDNGIKWERIS